MLVCKRRMFVLGTFIEYLTAAMKNITGEINVAIAVVPGGMSQLQVPDVVENKPFKKRL